MGKTSFNNTSDLIKHLSEKIADLNNGSLSLADIDSMVEDSRSLYEQLIVLRYKAFDTFGKPNQKSEPQINFEPVTKEAPIEIVPDIPVIPANKVEEMEEIPFDFSDITSSEPTTKIEEIQPAQEPSNQVEKQDLTSSNDLDEEEDDNESSINSLNSILKKEEDQSLRKQFQNSPISDIKSQISIGKRFEYISSMFANDHAAYEDAIEFLNTATNGHQAKLKLNELSEKYEWDLEDKSIIKFVELVERRYL